MATRQLDNDGEARLAGLLQTHFRTVWRALRRFGVAPGSIEDAAQEVFIVAAKKLATVEAGQELRFLYGVVLRVAAHSRRSLRNRREEFDEDFLAATAAELPSSDALLEEKRLRELLDRILDRMPDDLRTAFVLFEIEGFSVPKIAELCEIPVGTAASRLRRAREAFEKAAARLEARDKSRGIL